MEQKFIKFLEHFNDDISWEMYNYDNDRYVSHRDEFHVELSLKPEWQLRLNSSIFSRNDDIIEGLWFNPSCSNCYINETRRRLTFLGVIEPHTYFWRDEDYHTLRFSYSKEADNPQFPYYVYIMLFDGEFFDKEVYNRVLHVDAND